VVTSFNSRGQCFNSVGTNGFLGINNRLFFSFLK
jgi:hypothetical protein